MKNIIFYYLAILLPLGILIGLNSFGMLSSTLFVVLLAGYAIVYRSYTDGRRLFEKGIIQKSEIWKTMIGGYHFKYFRELYSR